MKILTHLKNSYLLSAAASLVILSFQYSISKADSGQRIVFNTNKTTTTEQLECLTGLFSGETGTLKTHEINLSFTGRITIGDLNADGHPDFVVANRDKLAAYDLCGNRLWQVHTQTNWDHPSHVYWNWSSYGYIGDADADGEGEFLHIDADWRTLYVRQGKTGDIKHSIDLGDETKWMYVLLGQRSDDTANQATRIFVTGSPGTKIIKALDIRSQSPQFEWDYIRPKLQNAYMPPVTANLDAKAGDEILHATTAVSEHGETIWRHNFSRLSVLGAAHTLTVKDIDPSKPGLEAVFSVYAPKRGMPSLLSYTNHKPHITNWRAFSPYMERHSHQHTVGDFDINKEGLETLARNNDAINHWLVDSKGGLLTNKLRVPVNKLPKDWDNGELVQGIEWDEKPGAEILYTERHVKFREIPRLVVTSSTRPVDVKTRLFHGGIDITRTDNSPTLADKPDPTYQSWFGYVDRQQQYNNDGPYEGAAHVVDLLGDGREEVLTWGANKILIYYNSGNASVKKRWGDPQYMKRKKLWCSVYNPR